MIGRVLGDAAEFCDELVVVDTGSSDATKDVAVEHGAKTFDFTWVDDFSAARNFSFEKCSGDWIIWLDADDRIPSQAQKAFSRLKDELVDQPLAMGVMVPYHRAFSEADLAVCTFTVERERVIRRHPDLRWVGPVHECVSVPADLTIRWPDAWVEHRPLPGSWDEKADRNLRILENALARGDKSPRTYFYLGNELVDHKRFGEALEAYEKYLRAAEVVVWERYATLVAMARCAGELGRDDEKVSFLLDAVRLDSSRAEAHLQLGLLHYDRKEWARAVPFFAAAAAAERPEDGFVDLVAYTWGPWDYMSVCHSELGRYEEAVDETIEALRTSNERDRLLENLRFYFTKLTDDGSS